MKTFVLLLCAALFVPAACAAASNGDLRPQRRILTVDGEADVKIPATQARLTVAIEAREKTARAAQSALAEKSNRVLNYLHEAKVTNLQTPGLSLQPLYESDSGKSFRPDEDRPVTGYRARWTATFDVPIARAGKVTDEAVRRGVTRILDLRPHATDEAVRNARRQALRAAARNARQDGTAVLDALGYKPSEIVEVRIVNTGPVRPMARSYAMTAGREMNAAATAVEGGTQDVTGRVTLEISY